MQQAYPRFVGSGRIWASESVGRVVLMKTYVFAKEESGGHKNNSRKEKVLPSTSADSHSTHMYVCMSAYLYVYVYVCVCVLILYMYGYVYNTGM